MYEEFIYNNYKLVCSLNKIFLYGRMCWPIFTSLLRSSHFRHSQWSPTKSLWSHYIEQLQCAAGRAVPLRAECPHPSFPILERLHHCLEKNKLCSRSRYYWLFLSYISKFFFYSTFNYYERNKWFLGGHTCRWENACRYCGSDVWASSAREEAGEWTCAWRYMTTSKKKKLIRHNVMRFIMHY